MCISSFLGLVLLSCTFASCCSAPPGQPSREDFPGSIGETQVKIQSLELPGSGLVLINLHDDENTGVEAAQRLLGQKGGRLVQLKHDGTRLISFNLEGRTFKFDPNRMFTDQGARTTLKRHGSFSEKALKAVRAFSEDVLERCNFERLSLVVTLHNNSDQGYSSESYVRGAIYASDAREIYFERSADPDDFFFVTDPELFEALRKKPVNVVLQDNDNVTDDGSLSVLAGRRGIPYINVEAQEGHLEQQVEMLRYVYALYGN